VNREDLGRWLIQILYHNYDTERYIPVNSLSTVIELEEAKILEGLSHLMESELVEKHGSGYKLSLKGYEVAHQRVTSYCPHL
jgi:RIO-like serine/threonine protein kinase